MVCPHVLIIRVCLCQAKLIANIDAELDARDINIELIQKQMTGQTEKTSDEASRGYNAVRFL